MQGKFKSKKPNKVLKEIVSILVSAVLAVFVFVVLNFV